ncbi:MAG: SGNH/GDSL hydrolase family protein [Treponema sp.]|nr:SGNH/GDSL hydrolase family protein [Treponema sp.]
MKKIMGIMAAALMLAGSLCADEARIQNVLAKIRRGEKVTVAVLGGSITTGYSSNPISSNSWAAKTEEWFKSVCEKSGSSLTFLNEGVSGTDSAFAVARVQDHIIKNKVDLVILEFAVNDQWLDSKTRQRTYEGLIRQIMNNSDTAVLALFVNTRENESLPSQQYEQQPICEHYHIPFVSWKDCVLKNGKKSDFQNFYDGQETVHPNNAGHASIASFIVEKLKGYWDNLPADKALPAVAKKLPAPKTDDAFEFVTYYHKDNISPSSNTGWKIGGTPRHDDWIKRGSVREGWQTNEAGSEITFEVEGSTIGLTYAESDQFRNATAWVTGPDGKDSQKVILQCFQAYRKGYYGWAYKELVHGDKVQKYTVHIQCSKRASADRAGKYCNVTGIIAAGK